MPTQSSLRKSAFTAPRERRGFALACALLAALPGAAAPAPAGGTITGRVFNAATKEYVRNAEVRVAGTALVTWSEDGGAYRVAGVPAGQAHLVVSYAGMEPVQTVVALAAGQSVTHDVELRATSFGGPVAPGEVVQLDKFEISEARSGQAKALMERRAASNAVNVVASDNYGELTMGDVGEFMKSMPGLSLDYVEVDTSAVRIGGLEPKYSTFTTDGARMATGTSNNNTGRQNSFEQMSITGIEAIEFNNTLTARMDADSPGGTINLRSKYAFQRKGRTIVFQVYGIGTSDAHLKREYFPDDKKHSRIFPAGQFGYADLFLGGRLGVEFNTSYNANFVQQDRVQMRYNYNTPASGATVDTPRLNDIMFRPGPKMTSRQAANLSLDYRLTSDLTFSWRSSYSFYDVEYVNQYTYLYAPVASQPAGSTITRLVANPVNATTGAALTAGNSPRFRTEYSHRYAGTPAFLLAPKLVYKGDTWEATLRGNYSKSEFNFRDNSKGFFVRTDTWITRLGFIATRPDEGSPTWTLTQTAGRPWGDPRSVNRDDDIGNNIRTSESDASNQQYGGYLDLKKQIRIRELPVTLFGGFGRRTNAWATVEGSYRQFQYVGPTNDLTQMAPEAVIPWTERYKFDLGLDGRGGNMTAQNFRADSNYATYEIYQAHPEYFVPDTTGNLTRRYQNNKEVQEGIGAAYVEGQTRVGQVRFDLGLRYERTKTEALVADVRPDREVTAAGYSLSTVEGINYKFRNGQQTTRRGKYDDWFLSGGAKYDLTRKLVGQLAFSESILRPDYGNLGGIATVNDTTLIVTVPNPQMRPEHATKYYAGLQYFLEPSGILGVSFYQLKVQDMQQAGFTVNPAEVGYSADDYSGYTFVSARNGAGTFETKGLTFEYNQQLTFLPRAFKGLGVYGSITRVIADGLRMGVPNRTANWGVRYRYGPFNVQINGTWQTRYRIGALGDTPATNNTGIRWLAARELWNVSAGYKITKNLEIMLSGRNIFNEPSIQYTNVPGRIYLYDVYGSLWNAGIRGSF
ncbi:MAG: TonB-dependent receptor [Verrucomicrobia bacterium]|nr:TonB-dependent receptor [Verrucomicrobiota bacterium]